MVFGEIDIDRYIMVMKYYRCQTLVIEKPLNLIKSESPRVQSQTSNRSSNFMSRKRANRVFSASDLRRLFCAGRKNFPLFSENKTSTIKRQN